MAMTSYDKNYDFHEETLSDVLQLVTNNTTRTLVHNELVYLGGFFGEVCEIDGILAGETGYINITAERTVRCSQVADVALMAGHFTIGNTLFFIPQVNANEGYLVDQNAVGAPAIAIGIVTSAAADDSWVAFRPFVQSTDLALVRDANGALTGATTAIATLNAAVGVSGSVLKMIKDNGQTATFTPTGDIASTTVGGAIGEVGLDVATLKAHTPNVVELVVGADATGLGLTFANATTGLAVGDRIIDLWLVCSASNGAGTLKLSHGAAGADISAALVCATINVLTRGALIVGGVITADGLTIIANGAADRGKMYLTYIKA